MKKLLTLMLVIAVLVLGCAAPDTGRPLPFPSSPPVAEEKTQPSLPGIVHHVLVQGSEEGQNFRLFPRDTSIAVGDTILWVNQGEIRQTISFEDGSFQEILPPGGGVSRTFWQAGEFGYGSEFNDHAVDTEERVLQGTVLVQ